MCRVCDFEAVELPGTCCPTHGQPLVSPALRGRAPIDERYVLVDPLDEGAFAEVSLAFDRQAPTGEPALVAIKQLKHDQRGAEVRARFRREGEMLRRLAGHPGIVGLRGQRHDGEAQYLALEYVDGINLERLIAERRRLPAVKATRVVMAVLDVLEHLHERGVIHRDLKPNNIMVQAIGDGPDEQATVRLLDLGIARRIDEENAMLPLITRRGWTVGTPFYMAPEQFDDSQVDARADIYAVGVVLFHLLSGHAPFQGSGHQVAQKHRGAPVPELDDGLGVPVAVESAMRRAMAKAPERRYGTARLMYAALGAAIGQPAEAPPRSTSRMRSGTPGGPGPGQADETLEVTDPELLQAVAAVSAARATMSAPIGSGRDLMQSAARRSVMPLPSRPMTLPTTHARGSSTARMPVGVAADAGAIEGVGALTAPATMAEQPRPAAALGAAAAGEVGVHSPAVAVPSAPAMPSMPILARPTLAPARRSAADGRQADAPVRAVATRPELDPPRRRRLTPAVDGGGVIDDPPAAVSQPASLIGAVPLAGPTPIPPTDAPLGAVGRAVAEPTRGRGPIPWMRASGAAVVALLLGLIVSWAVGGADGVAVWSSTPAAGGEAASVTAISPGTPVEARRIRAFRAVTDVELPAALADTLPAAAPSEPPRKTPAPAVTPRKKQKKNTTRRRARPKRSVTGAF